MSLYFPLRILSAEVSKLVRDSREENGDGSGRRCPKIRPRLILIAVMGAVNISLCLFFGISATSGASNYLLTIFMANTGIYTTYYCIMKHVCGERINKVPLLYTILGLICFLPAMYLFTKVSHWEDPIVDKI